MHVLFHIQVQYQQYVVDCTVMMHLYFRAHSYAFTHRHIAGAVC